MTRSSRLPLTACVVAVALAGGAGVTPAQATGPDAFDRADLDRDGFVSRAEFVQGRLSAFARLDSNADGMLARSELDRARRPPPGVPTWASFDTDRDGAITRAEVLAAPSPMFDRFDANRDGRLSRAESAPILPLLARAMR